MQENTTTTNQQNNEMPAGDSSRSTQSRYESDTQKLVHRHLEDKNHVITDEELKNIRVGMTPVELDEAAQSLIEGRDAAGEASQPLPGDVTRNDRDEDNKLTPWDTIES